MDKSQLLYEHASLAKHAKDDTELVRQVLLLIRENNSPEILNINGCVEMLNEVLRYLEKLNEIVRE